MRARRTGKGSGVTTEEQPRAVVFAPTPMLTVTLERGQGQVPAGGDGAPEIHVHAGGQGVWLARMMATLGADVSLCGALGGELGPIVRGLVTADDITVRAVDAGGTGAYVHDRRSGDRVELARSAAPPLDRHAVDDLHGLTLAEGMSAAVAVLSGPDVPGTLEPRAWERLSADLTAVGVPVVADLSGDNLTAALRGGLDLVKVSSDEVVGDGRAPSAETGPLLQAMRAMCDEGARSVVVSRAGDPALVLSGHDGELLQVVVPPLQEIDHRGAGDSMTAGIAVGLARGLPLREAVALGAAAGALNITRHGLATGRRDAIEALAALVEVRPVEEALS